MSKRIFALVTGITGGAAAIATTVVTFIQPAYAPAIVGAIGIAATAITEICGLFVKEK